MNINVYSYIYFVQGASTELIKIGKTNGSREERVRNLQTGSPDALITTGVTFEPRFTEANIHVKFNKFRKHGEWFHPAKDILLFIPDNCFRNCRSAYLAYPLVLGGAISYFEAVAMSEKELNRIVQKTNFKEIDSNGIYKI